MKSIAKKTFILILLALLILLVMLKFSDFVTGKSTYDYTHSWTKAICNETHCQDYQIFCNREGELVNQIEITGAMFEIRENWIDPRNETDKGRVCE